MLALLVRLPYATDLACQIPLLPPVRDRSATLASAFRLLQRSLTIQRCQNEPAAWQIIEVKELAGPPRTSKDPHADAVGHLPQMFLIRLSARAM